MRGLPAAITAALTSEVAFEKALFKMTVGSSISRWTDCDQQIPFDGNYWTPTEVKFNSVEQAINGGIANIDITLSNVDNALSNLALGNELRGCSFMIYKVMLTNYLSVVGCSTEADLTIILDGLIDSCKFDRQDANLIIVDDMINSYVTTPRRTFYPTCPWTFKGTECGYTGGATICNHTKPQCITYGRQDNFGGWEYINELIKDNLYWGQRTKTWGAT